jgi:hypothetical protein
MEKLYLKTNFISAEKNIGGSKEEREYNHLFGQV